MNSTANQTKARVAAISIAASSSMAILKLVVGVWIGSLALISEALHSSIDLIATIITWVVVRVSGRPADHEHHYGHGKYESLSALGVIALLYLLAGGILVQAYSNLRDGAPLPTISVIPFAVLLLDIVVNLWRARALARAARETKSEALAADALHFMSDVLGSFAVIIGLGFAAFGYAWGDAAAAMGIAIIIAILGFRLTRSTVQTLLDRAPDGSTEIVEEVLSGVRGIVEIERVRIRKVGPTHFVDATVHVPRTFPIDRIEKIKCRAAALVTKKLGESDLSFTVIPVAGDNESVRERVAVIAQNAGVAIHHVTVHDLGGKLTVSADIEVDGEMPLVKAHDIAHDLETKIREEFGPDTEVETHIEPLEPEMRSGVDATPARLKEISDLLAALAATGPVTNIHDVRVRDTATGEIVNFHCYASASLSVNAVHERVDEIERTLREQFPSIKRVISHAEPHKSIS